MYLRSLAAMLMFSSFVHAADRQLYEVRFYHFRSTESAAKFDAMFRDAVMPVVKDRGLKDVGVFKVLSSDGGLDTDDRVTIVAYDSLDDLLNLRAAYAEDPNFWPNAQEYFMSQPKGDPAYERVESMLLRAFTGMPELKVPGSGEGKSRRFELRTYKSENEIQGLLKVQMFNEGEIDIFKKTGLNAVFYGEALIGSDLPQLTYLLVHEDEEAQKKSWKQFIGSPEWKSLSSEEQYQVIKLQIKKHMLEPTEYSLIK